MKLKSYIPALGLGALMLGSCADQLNLDPFDAVGVDNAFASNTDFSNAVRGIYSTMLDGELYGGNYIAVPDIMSDNLIIASEGRLSQQTRHYWVLAGNNTWALWDDGYRAINRANLILENIENIDPSDTRNNFQGQALAMRAMAHFDMARVYAKPPQHAGGSDLGIPYMTSSDASQKPGRPSVSETFNMIIADLDEALTLIGNSNGINQLNAYSVNALLARVYFYMGDNANAITHASAAISSQPSIATYDEVDGMWKDENDAGVLFKIANTDQDNVGVGVQYSQTGPTGVRSEYVVDFDFYSSYLDNADDTDDIRLDVYFSTSEFAGSDFNHIAKWFGRTGSNANVSDIQVLRAEEMYLIRAEARAITGDDAGALTDLNTLRDERYTAHADGETGAALLAAIRLERRKELAFEGHRFYDLKRLNQGITRSNNGDLADGTGTALPADALSMPAGDTRLELPIPQAELNANENMEQNPGY